jgi:uncharacterized membrane protein
VTVELESGPDRGRTTEFTVGDQGDPVDISVGDDLRVFRNPLPPTAVIGGVRVDPYSLADFERRRPLLWLAALFGVLVVALGRWRGLRALVGLGISLGVVLLFVVPAILDGQPPLTVALVGALAIMLATIPLTHGLGPKTVAACLGTSASLVLTLFLARGFASLSHLTGVSSDEAVFLRASLEDVSLQGLLLAGVVIAALGVLDDLTVTQSSTVLALRSANPGLGFRALFRRSLSVGHDHITATVNTLVLAYAGASLPVLLIFSLADVSFAEALNGEAVAEEVVATLVGSIGLIAAVPVTTAIAAFLAVQGATDDTAHVHVH